MSDKWIPLWEAAAIAEEGDKWTTDTGFQVTYLEEDTSHGAGFYFDDGSLVPINSVSMGLKVRLHERTWQACGWDDAFKYAERGYDLEYSNNGKDWGTVSLVDGVLSYSSGQFHSSLVPRDTTRFRYRKKETQ